jgi:hypothetical protein
MAFRIRSRSAAVLSSVAFAACASAGGGASAGTTTASAQQQAATGQLRLDQVQWTGSFHSSTQVSAQGGTHNVVSGNLRLTSRGPNTMHAHISLSTHSGMHSATNLHWALANGQCRSGGLPIGPLSRFPDISMSNDRGDVDADVQMPLPTSGSYHVNVYLGQSSEESDILTCADLQMSEIKR